MASVDQIRTCASGRGQQAQCDQQKATSSTNLQPRLQGAFRQERRGNCILHDRGVHLVKESVSAGQWNVCFKMDLPPWVNQTGLTMCISAAQEVVGSCSYGVARQEMGGTTQRPELVALTQLGR
jgi:hypothetical protein